VRRRPIAKARSAGGTTTLPLSCGSVAGAVFVLTDPTVRQQGPVAALVSTAGWASAARRVLGQAWIATPTATLDPDEARRAGSGSHLAPAPGPGWARRVPVTVKTAAKDLLQWRKGRNAVIDHNGPWRRGEVTFVWQRHELFQTAGIDLARMLEAPSVLFVTAPQVWEAKQWGIRRPGWERLLERRGDVPAMRAADLVACGSQPVAEAVLRLGVRADRVLITPTGVDLDLFRADGGAGSARTELGLDGRFVVGWVGSFRGFHAVSSAIGIAAEVDGATLLLVGDGPERPAVERLARTRGVDVVFTGTVPHQELPAYLAAMDVAIITAARGRSFHYSPLKLAEYLAAGCAVVAPRVGQIVERLTDGNDVVLYDPGDDRAFATALRELRDDQDRRATLGRAARATAERDWSWDHQVHRILAALGEVT
jgi:glycosyltransferase involved in cell wall biosynthesis